MLHPIDDIAAFLFGYLCGSIPFGVLITRIAGAPDVRSIGSGNIGATNVLRTGRKGLAAATLLGDMLKGTAAVAVVNCRLRRAKPRSSPRLAPFSAICFRSGSALRAARAWRRLSGFCSASAPGLHSSGFAVLWLAVAAVTRYSSLAALIASAATPAVLWWSGNLPEAELFLLLAVLLWIMHRANIARLVAGTESKIGSKSAR